MGSGSRQGGPTAFYTVRLLLACVCGVISLGTDLKEPSLSLWR